MTRECATEQEYKADTEDSVWDLTDLSALTAGRQAAPEFPTEVLGEFWGDWATTKAAQASAPVDYVACSLLAAGAAAIGNSCVVSPWPGWGEPSVIWMALVGNPSSGKSPALDVPLDLLRKLEAELGVNFSDKLGNFEAAKELAKIKHVEWEKTVKAAAKNDAEPPPLPQDAMEPDKPVRPRLCLSDTTPRRWVVSWRRIQKDCFVTGTN